mgnify:CR=1 FL=1
MIDEEIPDWLEHIVDDGYDHLGNLEFGALLSFKAGADLSQIKKPLHVGKVAFDHSHITDYALLKLKVEKRSKSINWMFDVCTLDSNLKHGPVIKGFFFYNMKFEDNSIVKNIQHGGSISFKDCELPVDIKMPENALCLEFTDTNTPDILSLPKHISTFFLSVNDNRMIPKNIIGILTYPDLKRLTISGEALGDASRVGRIIHSAFDDGKDIYSTASWLIEEGFEEWAQL